jgi:copper transport protein
MPSEAWGMRLLKWLVACTAAMLIVLFSAGPAGAHAQLISSSPAGGATIDKSPSEIVLRFNERIEASFGGIQVFDADGNRIPTGEPKITGSELRLPLPELKRPGFYTVVFRVISADSHPVESRFAFNFKPAANQSPNPGSPSPAAGSDAPVPLDIRLQEAGPGTRAGLAVARFANYLSLTALVGMLVFGALLLADSADLGLLQVRLAKAAALAAVVWGLSAAALFVFGLSNAAAVGVPGVLGGALPGKYLGTRFGEAVTAQAAVALATFLVCAAAAASKRRSMLLAGLGLAALGALAPGWWGHAATAKLEGLALFSDWAHVLAVTAWVGGLAALVVFVLRPSSDLSVAPLAKRFSRLAGVAVWVVLGTGIVNAVMRIQSMEELTGTRWGKLVLLKVALFGGIGVIGLMNRTRMLPRLSQDPSGTRRAFRKLALAELALMVAAFGTATALTSSIPADAEAASRIQTVVTAFGKGQINLTVDPAKGGDNVVHLYFLDSTGRQQVVTSPRLIFSYAKKAFDADLLLSGPGHYTVLNQRFDRRGDYGVEVSAAVDGQRRSATGAIRIR